MKKLLLFLTIGHLLAGCQSDSLKAREKTTFDTVILGGRVIDPETGTDTLYNVGILEGKIKILTHQDIDGREVIQAEGLVVAPGFIDLHAHGQSVAADRMQAFDGVTTALELESGILPVGEWYDIQSKVPRVLNYGTSAAWTFARISEMEELEMEADLLWFQRAFSFQNWVNNPASPVQVERIVARVEQGIKEGSIGVGINAGYAPGGGYKELLAIHALAARYDVPTFTHISGDFPNDPKSAAENVGQIISYSASVGSQDHICHLNSSSLKDISTTALMIKNAQERGLDISTEAYTYGASSTTIGAALFNEEAIEKKNITYSQIELNGVPLNEESFTATRKNTPGAIVVFRFLNMPEEAEILDESVLFPGGAIASDAMPWVDKTTGGPVDDLKWPLDENAFAHPRSAGTFTKLLAHWVREREDLTLSEAIEKAALIPAQILEKSVDQMKFKGRIQEGMDADIIVFDPETVQDKATFTEPNQPAEGMSYVMVGGELVVKEGKLNREAHPGKPIRRKVMN